MSSASSSRDGPGHLGKTLCRIVATVEQHVLDRLAHVDRHVIVDRKRAGVHDAHVHASADRVVEKDRVHGLPQRGIAAKRERQIADPAAHLCVRQVLLDGTAGFQVCLGVFVVLFDASGHGEDVGIEDDVLRREPDFLREQAIGARADFDFPISSISLA